MTGAATTTKPATRWRELDVLRGAAAAFMILNHAAVESNAPPPTRWVDACGFLGSFAPVLFFFLTGLGHGVQSAGRRPGRRGGTLVKVAILIAADAFLWVSPEHRVGMDFLGFIGLSMLLLAWVERLPRSGLAAAGLGLSVWVLRFLVGPRVGPKLPTAGIGHVLGFLLGVHSLPGFSYPPAPWLIYPLLGYALGRLSARYRARVHDHRLVLSALLTVPGVLLVVATAGRVARGGVLFRWGSMSLAYFLASLAVVAFGLALVTCLESFRPLHRGLDRVSLSGVRSFAVVPLHYVALAAVVAALGHAVGDASYARNTLIVLVASFAASAVVPWASALVKSWRAEGQAVVWGVVGAGALAAYAAFAVFAWPRPVHLAVGAAVQLALCLVLTLPVPALLRAREAGSQSPGGRAGSLDGSPAG